MDCPKRGRIAEDVNTWPGKNKWLDKYAICYYWLGEDAGHWCNYYRLKDQYKQILSAMKYSKCDGCDDVQCATCGKYVR